jgi:hypothetical protein
MPLAQASIGTGALTAALTFALIAMEWVASFLGAPKAPPSDKPTVSSIIVLVLSAIAVLGTLAAWGYLGYCVLSMYIKHRRFPNVESCDATL